MMTNRIESWLKATYTKEEELGEPKRERRRSLHYEQSRPHCCFVPSWGVLPTNPLPSCPNWRLLYMQRDPTTLICNFLLQNSRGRRSRSTNTQQLVIAQLCFDFFTPMTGLGSKRFQQFQTLIRCNLGSLAELLSAQSWNYCSLFGGITIQNNALVKGDYLHDYFICDVVKRDQGGIIFVFDLILTDADMDSVWQFPRY